MKKNREELERLQESANPAKERLMDIMDDLYEKGFIRKAQALGTIIEKLEIWQNS